MATTLPSLIDKQDSFEIVRDQVAGLLFENQTAQQALATAGGKDPALWKLRVFLEASNPWEQFLNVVEAAELDLSPIVNVWFDSGSFDKSKGDPVQRQAMNASINVDIYGCGISQSDGGTGHLPGDREAALTAQRGYRLCRNILMAGENTYLQLRGLVWSRWVQSVTEYQPQIGEDSATQIVAMRLSLGVEFNEFAPQVEAADTLDLISVDVFRDGDGLLVAEAAYDYSSP